MTAPARGRPVAEPRAARPTYGQAFASREFRALFGADVLSVVGDQMARIAVALLVYNRSHSPLLAALAFAVTLVPWVVGGPLLSPYADRLPRRRVMIVCDLARAVMVAGLAVPHLPTGVMLMVLSVVALLGPPFSSARAAMMPDVLPGELYIVGQSASNIGVQAAQVMGFVLGGALVALSSVSGALLTDAATFVASALLTRLYVQARPSPRAAPPGVRAFLADSRSGVRVVVGDPVLRSLLLLAWTGSAVLAVPEGLAVVYARVHHGGSLWAGALTAAQPLGVVAGSLVVGRLWGPVRRARSLLPMAAVSLVPLLPMVLRPSPAVTLVLWTVAGVASAYQLSANRLFVAAVPADHRGRAFGIAVSGLYLGQGLGFLLGGAAAQAFGVGPVVAVAGAVGLVVISGLALRWPGRQLLALAGGSSFSRKRTKPQREQEGGPTVMRIRRQTPRWPGVTHPATVVWALTGLLVLAVVALQRTALSGLPVISSRVQIPWWALAFAFAVTHYYAIDFEFRQQVRSVTLTQLPLVLGLYFATPQDVVLARVVASGIVAGVLWAQSPQKLFFNVARAGLDVTLALIAFRALTPLTVGPGSWPWALLACLVHELSSFALVSIVVAAHERGLNWRRQLVGLPFGLGVTAVITSLGLVAMTSLHYDLRTAWALALVFLLGVATFHGYKRALTRHATLDRLYTFASGLGPVASDTDELGPALMEVRDLMHADRLELALVGGADDGTLVVVEDGGLHTSKGDLERVLDEASRGVLASGLPALRERVRVRPWGREPATGVLDDLVAVPVSSTAGVVGVLRARHRSGDVRGFDTGDLRMLEAVASQLGTALEKGRLIADLRRAATCDGLTGLANLDHARAVLTDMLCDDPTEAGGVVVLLIDLYRFRDINDTLGHEAGDVLLREVANRLREACPPGGTTARVGGDQFALLLPGPASGEVARLAALAVKSRVEGPIRLADLSADVQVVVGLTRAPAHGTDAPTLLRRAELAMGAAKGTTGGIAEWEAHLENSAPRRLTLVSGLRQALAEGQVTVHYQPKLALGSGAVTGMEALARWRHPELGPVSPAEFVVLAEASGLIGALTTHVMRQALEDCREWHQARRNIGVSVNLSARSLADPVLIGQVAALLTATRVDPQWLTLEITESSVMENPTRSIEVLRQLRALGVRLAIDDFGTGYSSLTYVKGLPVHEIKVDQAFVRSIDSDSADRAVVRAIVQLSRSLGLSTVAEGVEGPSQALVLEDLEVEEVQGYFYARPMPASEVARWLRTRRSA